jgi:hypothetical protein
MLVICKDQEQLKESLSKNATDFNGSEINGNTLKVGRATVFFMIESEIDDEFRANNHFNKVYNFAAAAEKKELAKKEHQDANKTRKQKSVPGQLEGDPAADTKAS